MRVLIVDDEELVANLLSRYLSKWGHEAVTAADGAAAWQRFESEPFPMILTDWNMPRMSGVELIRRVRGHQCGAQVYAVLLTGRSTKEDVVAGMDAGADDFLAKPFDKDELRVRVREGERIVQLERARVSAEERCRHMHALIERSALSVDHDLEEAVSILGKLNGGTEKVCEQAIARLLSVRELLASLRKDAEPPRP